VIPAPIPTDDRARVAALLDLAILDTDAEERFDRLTRLAARILDVPIALVTLIDADRQWFKSRVGIDDTQTSRDVSFCGHAILHDDLFVVRDARADERFHDNPYVVGDPEIRFYAGRPLHAAGGERVGTLCVVDREPRDLDARDRQTLEDLAALVERELQQRTLAQAWEQHRSLQARYQAIFENIDEAISLIDPGKGWILGNAASDRILGYPPGTTRLDNRRSFVHPDDVDIGSNAFGEVVAGTRGPNDPWIVRVKAADGTWRWFETVGRDLRDNPDVGAVLTSTRDVTDRLLRAHQHELVVKHSPLGIWTLDSGADVTFANERFASMLGYAPEEMIGRPATDFYPPEGAQAFRDRWSSGAPNITVEERDLDFLHRDGSLVTLEMIASPFFSPDGKLLGGTAMVRDRRHERELEEQAAAEARRFELLFDSSSDVITVLDADGTWKYSSPAGTRLLGYPAGHDPEGGIFALIHPEDVELATNAFAEVRTGVRGPRDPITFRVIAHDGQTRYFESTAVNLLDEPLIDGIMVVSRDVTERVHLTDMLAHAAGHDPLTDLVNRGAFTERLDAALARAKRDGRSVAVCFIDLDHFKAVNDTHGHRVGDEVLVSVADRMRKGVRAGDVAARLGGDEFIVLCEQSDEADLRALADRISAALNRPHDTSAGPVGCGASIGVALADRDDEAGTLMARADTALYGAKHAGRGRVVFADT
jgi:diguanylate cyclase (GGDEF)-like protein/PAS domain S-box-containing protein